MDTPPLIHRLLYREPGKNAMARATLGFCGVRPVRAIAFGSVRGASSPQRQAWLLGVAPVAPEAVIAVLGVMAVLAIGYTLPPLMFSYRGLGELDVAVTHSIGVLLCGFVFLGGGWRDPLPWLLSLPLLLAILPSITLSGIPDLEADAAVGKRTLAVRLGHRGALTVALVFTLLATACALAWSLTGLAASAYGGIALVVVPHGAWLAWLLTRHLQSDRPPGRIDGLMAVSLGYVLWFGLWPLFRLA